jgi:formylglycine-generating enzyme
MKKSFAGMIAGAAVAMLLSGCSGPETPAPAPDIAVTLLAIPGVAAPASGGTPVTSLDTVQYAGDVSWSPAVYGTFSASTVYVATIVLTPKPGYTLRGVAANSFTAAGAVTTNSADSGAVTAVFPNVTMIPVAGGTYNNGSANMTVSGLLLSQHEITGEQYSAVMGIADPSYFAAVANNPVERVNWFATLVFCNKLSVLEGFEPVYSIAGSHDPADWGAIPATEDPSWDAVNADWGASGYRLPTEAEWKFAARGGNSTHNYPYAGSNTLGDVAWYSDNSGGTTHAVGAKAANELGLYDMSGNVSEWCWDFNGSLPSTAQTDYRGPASGSNRVGAGCSWNDPDFIMPLSARASGDPYSGFNSIGFRVARP